MRISVGAGTYVVAVSGGVDSMVLLDLLRTRPSVKLIVAHFDHGIREDSSKDRQHVQSVARKHGLTFVHHEGKLGATASEAVAREARYEFLRHVKEASGAKAIITAHHQDDVLETAILNLMRGSGRRGLTSLRTTDGIVRPLVGYEKSDIHDYAATHAIAWREDPTNSNTKYTRNYVRANVIPKMTTGQRAQLTILLQELHGVNDKLDAHIVNLLHTQPSPDEISRSWFVGLPHDIAREVIYGWLRQHQVKDVSRSTVERLVIAVKTAQPGKIVDIDKKLQLRIEKTLVCIQPRVAVSPKTKSPKTKR